MFLFKRQLKKYSRIDFFKAFGTILVLAAAVLCSKPMVCHPKKLGVVTASHDKSLSNGSFIKESGLFGLLTWGVRHKRTPSSIIPYIP